MDELPVSGFSRTDEPFKVYAVVVWHEGCVVEHSREQVDGADGGE